MYKYILKRVILLIPVIFGVLTFVFLMLHLVPGDPVELMLGETALQADKEALRKELKLDEPITVQYLYYLGGLIKGDLGRSLHTTRPVLTSILERFPATLELAFAALLIAILIAIPLGIIAALRQYSLIDNGAMFFALLGVSIPNFWLGPLLIIFFSLKLGWFPVSGRGSFLHLVLPAFTLGTGMSAILARMTRSTFLEVLGKEYITVAKAKGIRGSSIVLKHALRNALIPVVTIIGLQLGALLSGAIITETIFSWPGIGRLTIQAINTRDYPLVQGCVLFISLSYVIVNLLTDLFYAYIDPRIRYR